MGRQFMESLLAGSDYTEDHIPSVSDKSME